MSTRRFVTGLSLVSALVALAPAVSHAQADDIVRDVLSQIISGGQPGGEAYGGCQPIDRGFYYQRLNRITNRFYTRINRDINEGILEPDDAYPYRRRVRFLYREGQNFIADGCLTQYEKNRFSRDVRRLDEDLDNLEGS